MHAIWTRRSAWKTPGQLEVAGRNAIRDSPRPLTSRELGCVLQGGGGAMPVAGVPALATAVTSPGPLFDNGDAVNNNPAGVPAFFTYLGQFLDHDMTLDSLPLPVDFVDPNTIPTTATSA
jgi:hypothetical protein